MLETKTKNVLENSLVNTDPDCSITCPLTCQKLTKNKTDSNNVSQCELFQVFLNVEPSGEYNYYKLLKMVAEYGPGINVLCRMSMIYVYSMQAHTPVGLCLA